MSFVDDLLDLVPPRRYRRACVVIHLFELHLGRPPLEIDFRLHVIAGCLAQLENNPEDYRVFRRTILEMWALGYRFKLISVPVKLSL